MNTSNSRYRSYRDKKSQSKRFNTNFSRILILLLIFSVVTTFFVIAVKVSSDSMSPSLNPKDALIIIPANRLTIGSKKDKNKLYRRGEIVLSGTNYQVEANGWEKLFDPLVRVLTLQRKSLIYSNSEYKGRAVIYRVVGIPGDTIKIKDYTVYIKPKNEKFFLSEFELTEVNYDTAKLQLPPKWKKEYPFSTEFKETLIPEGKYFLVSDNRATLNDSRIFGPVDKLNIKGRAVFRYWPLNEIKIF